MPVSRWTRALSRVFVIALITLPFSITYAADEIPWSAENFESTRVNSPIQDVLRSLVRQNGQNVDFRPGVEGNVTFDFNMPLQEAFNRLINQNGLTYDFDSRTNTINIGPYRGPRTKVFYTPSSISLQDVQNGIDRFGMSGDTNIIYDEQTQSLLITGDETAVAQVSELVQNLDQALIKRQQTVLEQQRQKLALEREEQALRLEQQRSILEIKRLESEVETAGAVELEVIPLRFASVGATKMTFMDDEVTVPGIDESLGNILGTNLQTPGSTEDGEQTSLAGNKAVVSMDLRTNSVIVRGTRAEIDEIKEIVAVLDQPLPMIEMEVMVVQATDEAREALGVQWATGGLSGDRTLFGVNSGATFEAGNDDLFLGDRAEDFLPDINDVDGNSQAGGVGAVNGVVNPAVGTDQRTNVSNGLTTLIPATEGLVQTLGIPSIGSNVAGTTLGTIIWGNSDNFVQATINALESDGKAQTLASPRIVALNNVTAKVAKADTLNVQIKNNQTGDVGFEAIQTGLVLEITPTIVPGPDGEETLIRLNINASNSALSSVGSEANQTTNDEVQTQVIIPDGATFMLGGLFSNTRTELQDGIPVLSKIPLLGSLFGTKSSLDANAETIFFITPKILDQSELTSARGASMKKYLNAKRNKLDSSRNSLKTDSLMLKNELKETKKLLEAEGTINE